MAAMTMMTRVIGLLASAPTRLGGGGALDISLGRIVASLIACLVIAVAVALVLRRSGGRVDWTALRNWKAAPARRIEVIETRRISPHADVCLFRCDGEDYLVLSSAAGQRVLRRAPATRPCA